MINIEDIEAELGQYFRQVEYLPAEVKSAATLMSQDLCSIVANLLHSRGVSVNWRDGSYRGDSGIYPVGYSPARYGVGQ